MGSNYPEHTWKRMKTDLYQKPLFAHLIKGNLYAFMNKLLEFKPHPETCHPWVPKKRRRYGAN